MRGPEGREWQGVGEGEREGMERDDGDGRGKWKGRGREWETIIPFSIQEMLPQWWSALK